MKYSLWLVAMWLTAATAAPAGFRIPSGLTKEIGTALEDEKPAAAVPKISTGATKPKAAPAAAPAAAKPAKPAAESPATKPKPAPVVSKGQTSAKVEPTKSVATKSVATKSTKTATTSAAASTAALNRAAWPAHPVIGGDIPTDKQISASKPINVLSLPAFDASYYTGPQLPANFSAAGTSNAQANSELSVVQPPDNVDGPVARGLFSKGGSSSGSPRKAKQFTATKAKCPKSFQDVVPFIDEPRQHQAMFYSAVDQFEYDFAKQHHLALVKPSIDPFYLFFNDKCPDFWDHASEAFASLASGDVPVLLPDVPLSLIAAEEDKSSWPLPQWPLTRTGGQSIWEKVEWPRLKQNPKVCRVWRVGKTGQPLLLMVRTGPQCSYAAVTPGA